MGTINSAFGIISGALEADQSALSTIANNVANANTPGYTREVPDWQEDQPVTIRGRQAGDGVTETGATSLRDDVLVARLDQQQQLAAASGTRLTALDSVQALFPPDSGEASSTAGDIGSDITAFFSSFSSLEANPTDNSLREQVLSSANTLAGDISSAASSLNGQAAALSQEAGGVTSQVNSLAAAIAQLNGEIQTSSPNGDAGTLQDQRNEDISQLSQLIGVNQIPTENNGLSITTTSGQLLVAEGNSYQMTSGTVDGTTHFYMGTTDITADLASGGGQIGGYLTARDEDIPAALNSLNDMAYGISTAVNKLNNAGVDLNGVSGTAAAPLNIFNAPAEVANSAMGMKVVMTDPSQIAAAGAGQGTGDNANAIAIANLANESLLQPTATSNFSLTQNLNPASGTATGSVTLYDAQGHSYNATVTYTNTAANAWSYNISVPETLTPATGASGQVSYSFGTGETVNAGTSLTITGTTAGGTTATIAAPPFTYSTTGTAGTPPETVADYASDLTNALTAAGITGVTVTGSNGVLAITGATATAGSVVADTVASANASGTLTFNAGGQLMSPSPAIGGIGFSGFSDGATALTLNWNLSGPSGGSLITQGSAASAQSASSQDGMAGDTTPTPINYYSNFVSTLGATVSGVQAENTAQSASVSQLQTQNNALSEVNLNDEASALSTLQSSYQAASQVFNILNSVMTSALNLGEETAVS